MLIILQRGCIGMAIGGSQAEEFPRKVVPEFALH